MKAAAALRAAYRSSVRARAVSFTVRRRLASSTSAQRAVRQSRGVLARNPVCPSVMAPRNGPVALATTVHPASTPSKYFSSLFASQYGLSNSSGAITTSQPAMSRSMSA